MTEAGRPVVGPGTPVPGPEPVVGTSGVGEQPRHASAARSGGPAEPVRPAAVGATPAQRRAGRSRVGELWVVLTVAAVILLLLLVFILENSATVDVAFFGMHGHLPLGVALLLAAVFGVLLVAVPGYGRIIQLRRAAGRTPGRPHRRGRKPAP